MFLFRELFGSFLAFVISLAKINDLPERHAVCVAHGEPAFECCEYNIVKR